MGQTKEVRVPDIGDSGEVDVVEVLVSAGDSVEVDSPLISLESDKASMDVPSPLAGKVSEVKVSVGDQVATGAVILLLEVAEGGSSGSEDGSAGEEGAEGSEPESDAENAEEENAAGVEPQKEATQEEREEEAEDKAGREMSDDQAADVGGGQAARRRGGDRDDEAPEAQSASNDIDEEAFSLAYASPAVRRLARELGVDLGQVEGTGRKSRILREDVQNYVKGALGRLPKAGAQSGDAPQGGPGIPPVPAVDFSRFGETEEVPLSRIRRVAATNLHRSWLNVPHVTQHDEADITEMDAFRKSMKAEGEAEGVKLTPVAFLIRAVVAALKRFPDMNSSLSPDGQKLIHKRYYHIGIAVDTDDGLVVPVIRNADQKGLYDLARDLAEVSGRARDGKLKMDDVQGASFTISSLGSIGGTAFTPIVNAPEVGILGVARAEMKPVWRDGEFVPRLMLPLSLSYDHRVIDGAAAVRFTTYLGRVLGDLRRLLL